MLPLKLVSLNAYLISKEFNRNRITHPNERANRIKSFVRNKDLCFLQEVWGPGLVNLIDEGNHNFPPGRGPYFSFSSSFAKSILPQFLVDAAHSWRLYGCGGLYDLSAFSSEQRQSAKCVYRSKHTFTVSQSRSLKGIEASLWNIPHWGNALQLLVFNTHLDPSWKGAKNRPNQIDEILEFMAHTMDDLDKQTTIIVKSDLKTKQGISIADWPSRTGVLLLGDFNIKASSVEYQQLLQRKEWKDFFQGMEQYTYAESNSLVPCSNLFESNTNSKENNHKIDSIEDANSGREEDYGRIDFIFGVARLGKRNFLPLQCLSRSIEIQDEGQELSDHYPLVLELVPEP